MRTTFFGIALIVSLTPAFAKGPRWEDSTPENRALSLVFMYNYVPFKCPDWRIDERVFQKALAETGYTAARFKEPELAQKLQWKREAFADDTVADTAGRCEEIVHAVGPFGTAVQGIIIPK